MEVEFCLEALGSALRQSRPEIFNSDQGSQFTSERFLGELERRQIAISMDGRGRYLDNVFIERLWRSLKYEKGLRSDSALDLDQLSGRESKGKFSGGNSL